MKTCEVDPQKAVVNWQIAILWGFPILSELMQSLELHSKKHAGVGRYNQKMHVFIYSLVTVLLKFAATTYGQEFYIGFLSSISGGSFTNLEIVVGTPDTSAEFLVESSNGVIHQGTVTRNAPVAIDPGHEFQVLSGDFIDRLRGLRIYSTGNESIYALAKNSLDFVNLGAYLAYPCQTFETESVYEYFAISVNSTAGPSQFLLVGCENDTKITVVPTKMISIPQDPQNQHSNSTNIEPGATSHQFTLHTLQTLLISSEDDMTGTKITSNKPLTVISGHQCATVPSTGTGCEPLTVQVPPTFTWGTEFLLSPFAGVQTFRAVTSENNTSFRVVCGTMLSLFQENVVFQHLTDKHCYLETSKPVLLTQVAIGDPAIALISAIDQYIHETEFFSLPTDEFTDQYISVTVAVEHYNPTAILLDGTTINCQWQGIYNGTSAADIIGYGCNTTVSSVSGSHTRHTVTHSNPDGLISVHAYGFNEFPAQGYAYLTGQELKVSDPETGN